MAFLRRNKQAIAFGIMAIAVIFALNSVINTTADHLYRDQIAACEQTKNVAIESNQRIPAARSSVHILRKFLVSARKARLAAYHRTHAPSDATAAKEYLGLIQSLDRGVHFAFVPIVNCQKIVRKP
jgi:hypothetical protein